MQCLYLLFYTIPGLQAQSLTEKMKDNAVLAKADRFVPGIISTDSLEFNAAFSPDGNTFYFSRSLSGKTRIFSSNKRGNAWSVPEPVSFSTEAFSDADPAFSPAGELYFISNRPGREGDTTKDYDIWKVLPLPGKKWSAPINVAELNSGKNEFYISFTGNGDACFSSNREGGFGEEDIYYSGWKGQGFSPPQNLGEQINSVHSEYDPFIAAGGSVLIFTSSGRSDSFGKADLYWSVNTNNRWTLSSHFDNAINTPTRDFCPYITGDTRYFYYSSAGDIKRLPLQQLPEEIQGLLKK